MIASEIMLPPHAPEIYLDRATLWNAVENCEKHPKAQLAYSFDIAMQNELTLEENMELARKFVQEQLPTLLFTARRKRTAASLTRIFM